MVSRRQGLDHFLEMFLILQEVLAWLISRLECRAVRRKCLAQDGRLRERRRIREEPTLVLTLSVYLSANFRVLGCISTVFRNR